MTEEERQREIRPRVAEKGVEPQDGELTLASYYVGIYWQIIRRAVFKMWNFKCAFCPKDAAQLHHGGGYEQLGDEDIRTLIPLCRFHHALFHGRINGNVNGSGKKDSA